MQLNHAITVRQFYNATCAHNTKSTRSTFNIIYGTSSSMIIEHLQQIHYTKLYSSHQPYLPYKEIKVNALSRAHVFYHDKLIKSYQIKFISKCKNSTHSKHVMHLGGTARRIALTAAQLMM